MGSTLKNCSVIQAMSIPHIVDGKSVLAQSQSGSGKTIAFSIGLLRSINLELQACQAIVLAPTRELVNQAADVLTILSKYLVGLTIATAYG